MNQLKCIIVDDDEVARLKVLSIARNFPILKIVGSFSSAQNALLEIDKQTIDVLFLDIDMPFINGLELRKKLATVPVCVYITSHPEYALESFELETLDFLIKPLQQERFAITVNRIKEFLDIKQKASLYELQFADDFIYIKQGYEQTKIHLHEILYLEALKDYTLLVTNTKRHCVFSGIGNLLKETHFESFVRVHRSFAVQKQFIQKVGSQNITLIKNIVIPLGNSYRDQLQFVE
ncbi:LytR/AlgR family response regulator transcription factor [Flavobacterium sp.]|uniref:LytR/AlgR family response regulator transcription factor n=1 Tax=Flavobacterium sp. TaxID=239 RepID=UPI0037523AD6